MADNKNNRKSNRNFSLEKPVERHFEIEKDVEAAPVVKPATPTAKPVGATPTQSNGGTQKKPQGGQQQKTNVQQLGANNLQSGKTVPPSTPNTPTNGGNDNGEEGSSLKKWIIIGLFIAAIVVGAYYLLNKNDADETATPESPQIEQNDSTQNEGNPTDSTASSNNNGGGNAVAPGTDNASANVNNGGSAPSDNVGNATGTDKTTASPTSNDSQNSGSSNVSKPASGSSSIEQMAQDVWDGKYGNNPDRRHSLGSDYKKVQKRVNEMRRQGLH